jgi:hypothetical protein
VSCMSLRDARVGLQDCQVTIRMCRMLLSEDWEAQDGSDSHLASNISSRGMFGLRSACVIGGAWGAGASLRAEPEARLPRPSQSNPHKDGGRRQHECPGVQYLRTVQYAHHLLPGHDKRLFQPVRSRRRGRGEKRRDPEPPPRRATDVSDAREEIAACQ